MARATRPMQLGTTIIFDKPNQAKRNHICKICGKSFKRSEHCIRHQRGHTQEKPFSCKFCQRCYSRRDLVVRHERTLHAAERHTEDRLQDSTTSTEHVENADEDTVVVQQDKNATVSLANGSTGPSGPNNSQHDRQMKTTLNDHFSQPRDPPPTDPPSTQFSGESVIERQISLDSSYTGELHEVEHTNVQQGETALHHYGSNMFDSMMNSIDMSLPADSLLELVFSDPFPGLSIDSLPPFPFPVIGGGLKDFSPLDQSSVSSQSPIQTSRLLQPDDSSATQHPEQGSDPFVTPRPMTTKQPNLPDTVNLRLPQIIQFIPAKTPILVYNDSCRSMLLQDLVARLPFGSRHHITVPSSTSMQKCLRTFIDSVLIHLPFLHLHTFDLEHTPSPLILAICALGALFRLERKTAASLFTIAEAAFESENLSRDNGVATTPSSLEDWVRPRQDLNSSEARPLWITQCKVLLVLFAAWSGDPAVCRKSLEGMAFLTNDYRSRMKQVRPVSVNKEVPSMKWEEWIHRESTKRLLYAIFVLNNLLIATYGIPPAISIMQDGGVEMPCDELLWDAPTEEQWQQRCSTRQCNSSVSIRDAVARLMYGKEVVELPDSSWNWSPFAAVVAMHGVSVQLWHTMQCNQSFSPLSVDHAIHDTIKSLIVNQTEAALTRCHAHINRARGDNDQPWNEAEGPLLFNCLALLRISYVRAFTGIEAADRMMLLCDNMSDVQLAIREYVAAPQARSPSITKAVSLAFGAFMTPMKAGALLCRKTAALSWSIEHAVAGWDCGLFVTKWLYVMGNLQSQGVELSESEAITLENTYNFLIENGATISPQTSLAAEVTRNWASFYDDTWVWGVTPRMGFILRQLADIYDELRWTMPCTS